MKNTNKTLFFFLLALLLPSIVMAEVSDELKRFNKCYAIFVEERVKTSDPLWKAVAAGEKTGTDACMEIFDKATLLDNGEIAKKNGVPDEIGLKVLSTFLRFQKSQLKVPNYASALNGVDGHTVEVIDSNEAVYHSLYSLFSPKQKFSDVVTRDYSIRAIRYSDFPSRSRTIFDKDMPILEEGTYKTIIDENGNAKRVHDNITNFSPTFVETGKLMGLVRDDIKNVVTNLNYLKDFSFTDNDINQHLGAGAIGTQSYLIGNTGKYTLNDGGSQLFRRWGKHVMEDFLCREFPALRTTDVLREVVSASKIPYKTGISCMACHSSMDPLSAVLRNKRVGYTNNGNVNTRVRIFGEIDLKKFGSPIDAEMPKLEVNKIFYRTSPDGRLYYRSYDGTLVHHEMRGVQALGEKMAETNDLYVCAAKRYYKFLTGITVDLADIGNINTPQFSEGAKYQRNKVIKMGLDLKNHQSARLLIKNIIEQRAFIYPEQGV